jgi:hypothetical protein
MNLLGIYEAISANIKAILIGLGIASLLGAGMFLRGCQYGEERMDAKWKSQIAMSKPIEVRRDTVIKYVPQPQSRGTVQSIPVEPPKDYQKAIDSLKVLVEAKDARLEDVIAPYKSTIETPAIGKLEVTVWPAWKQITYEHYPPPMKIETVTIEKERLVLAPRSTWETVRDVGIGVIGGALITYAVIRVSR